MPLVVLCGYPCSGKTFRAKQLENYLIKEHKLKVILISDEEGLCDRNTLYNDTSKEKELRSSLKSNVQKNISKNDVVILDASNYIKGYRYELYCISKAAKTIHCVIHCDVSIDICWEWNINCKNKYTREVFDALIQRFECPDSRNRWDSSLFTVHSDETLPFTDIHKVLFMKKPPPPNQSTQSQPLAATNFLYELDNITQNITKTIVNAQKTSVPGDLISIDGATEHIILTRTLTMPELTRLRRQFISYTKMHPVDDMKKIPNLYVQYLKNSL
ncbi:protein KTI12 homolog [Centruroides sculpturatus]|uniref:protein KTI12 homolog n=1 Tax=Centruroides sculpturatus TaxID=218467 RepID=UPI000C6CC030|nr:protein KTI12 homolog [Centruroides sculpturatus]